MASLLAAAHRSRSILSLFLDSNSRFISCNSPFSLPYCCFSTCTIKSSSSDVPAPDFFVEKYNFTPQIASKAASVSARLRKPQNPDLLLSFLKQKGFSHTQLERIIRHHSSLLSSCIETSVEPKFKIFQDLGFSATEAAQVVARDFSILHRQADWIVHSLSVLRRLLGSNENVMKLIKKHRSLFFVDPEKTLLPNIEFLKSCGVPMEQINTLLYTDYRVFFINPEKLRKFVDKVDEMGVDRTSKAFIYAVRAVASMSDEAWELKLKSFQKLGFSEDDILRVFRIQPTVLSVSAQKLKKVKEVLLETGKYDMSCIVACPESLSRSVENRYKPRLQVLNVLEKKNLIKKWPSLSTLCKMSNETFFKKFVAPNLSEVGEAFIVKADVCDTETNPA